MELTGGERLRERFGMAGLASVLARHWLARAFAELGAFSDGLVMAREGVDINLSTDNVASRAIAYAAVGYVHLCRGDSTEALAPLTRAVEVGHAAEVRNAEGMIVGLLGLQRARTGHLVEGVGLLARATSMSEQRDELYNLVPLQVWLGEAHLASGDLEQARRYGQSSLEMARTQPQRGTEAWAWRLLGEIAVTTEPLGVQEAEAAYREALTRASNLGMRPLVAHCHLGLGKLYRRTGDRPKAHEHLTTATNMYREIEMGFWLAQAEATLTERG
jgi:tetratricopeptide (TPR) repeat protein